MSRRSFVTVLSSVAVGALVGVPVWQERGPLLDGFVAGWDRTYFNSRGGETAVWNRCLTDEEMRSLMEETR